MDGAGGGGGGGAGAMARPVAVIVVGPDGVRVKPVLDTTKLALTALGVFGAAAALSMRVMAKKRGNDPARRSRRAGCRRLRFLTLGPPEARLEQAGGLEVVA